MIGEIVEHPVYGRGQLLALYRNGMEWMVRFETGLRFRRPRQEFNGHHVNGSEPTLAPLPASAPMPRTQFEARQLLEALRVGIAPLQQIQELTIGLNSERTSLSAGLKGAHQSGGAVRAVIGDYGFGKSHIVELTAQDALNRDFLVAAISLDLIELPPHRALDIYANLLRNLRYPDSDERGLLPLLERAADLSNIQQQLQLAAPLPADPLAITLSVFSNTASSRQRQAWAHWLMGGRKVEAMTKTMPRSLKLPSLYKQGNNARQIAYLLTGISVLARLAGYSGLALLIDEAESYSLLNANQQVKAALFFRTMIYAALREGQALIRPDTLPQHHRRDYPPAYGGKQALFFLFTATRSDNRMPLEDWLEPGQILELDPHHTPQEIGQFLQQVMGYHAAAYGYEPSERQGQIRRGAAEHLALGMRNNQLSIRGVVRMAVELFDLLYLYPDYEVATLLDELRTLVR
ncbi:MAG: ATP-binding protein [Chloroflexota bacterium]|nr:ATP-binding protein [Chloroflexota bacterium]